MPRVFNEFQAAYGPNGLSPVALQTSYAMAENVFAVTQSGTGLQRSPVRIWADRHQLVTAHRAIAVEPTAAVAICLVSSGPCIPAARYGLCPMTPVHSRKGKWERY